MNEPYDEFPNPMEETARWIIRHRPDVATQFDRAVGNEALTFLVALAFAAGKAYGERRNAEAGRER